MSGDASFYRYETRKVADRRHDQLVKKYVRLKQDLDKLEKRIRLLEPRREK